MLEQVLVFSSSFFTNNRTVFDKSFGECIDEILQSLKAIILFPIVKISK